MIYIFIIGEFDAFIDTKVHLSEKFAELFKE